MVVCEYALRKERLPSAFGGKTVRNCFLPAPKKGLVEVSRKLIKQNGSTIVPVTSVDCTLGLRDALAVGNLNDLEAELMTESVKQSNRYNPKTGMIQRVFNVPIIGHLHVQGNETIATKDIEVGMDDKIFFVSSSGEEKEFGPCFLPVPDLENSKQFGIRVKPVCRNLDSKFRLCHAQPNFRISHKVVHCTSTPLSHHAITIDLRKRRLVTNIGIIGSMPFVTSCDGKWIVDGRPGCITAYQLYAFDVGQNQKNSWHHLGCFRPIASAGAESLTALPSGQASTADHPILGEGVAARFLRLIPVAACDGDHGRCDFRVAVYGQELSDIGSDKMDFTAAPMVQYSVSGRAHCYRAPDGASAKVAAAAGTPRCARSVGARRRKAPPRERDEIAEALEDLAGGFHDGVTTVAKPEFGGDDLELGWTLGMVARRGRGGACWRKSTTTTIPLAEAEVQRAVAESLAAAAEWEDQQLQAALIASLADVPSDIPAKDPTENCLDTTTVAAANAVPLPVEEKALPATETCVSVLDAGQAAQTAAAIAACFFELASDGHPQCGCGCCEVGDSSGKDEDEELDDGWELFSCGDDDSVVSAAEMLEAGLYGANSFSGAGSVEPAGDGEWEVVASL